VGRLIAGQAKARDHVVDDPIHGRKAVKRFDFDFRHRAEHAPVIFLDGGPARETKGAARYFKDDIVRVERHDRSGVARLILDMLPRNAQVQSYHISVVDHLCRSCHALRLLD